MNKMRLYLLQSGWLTSEKSSLTYRQGIGEETIVPVPIFLITHPKGNVLVDTGMILVRKPPL